MVSFSPKSNACKKVPPFDEHNLSAWKSNAMEVIEFMDFDMLDIINKCPIIVTHQSSIDSAFDSKLNGKSVMGYNKVKKRVLNLDVKRELLLDTHSLFCLSVGSKLLNCLRDDDHSIIFF